MAATGALITALEKAGVSLTEEQQEALYAAAREFRHTPAGQHFGTNATQAIVNKP